MSKIYEEALLDAKKIRDAAEQAAKDQIMESITPQIRQMINNRILFEQGEMDDEEEMTSSTMDLEPPEADDDLDFNTIVDSMPDVDLGDEVMDAATDAAVSVYAAGDVNIELEQSEDDEDDLMTDIAIAESFARLVRHDFIPSSRLAERVERFQSTAAKLKEIMNIVRESRLSSDQQRRLELSFVSLVKEGVSLQNDLKYSGRGSQRLQQKLISTIKEMREMSSKYKRNIFDFLFEAEEDKKKMDEMMHEQDDAEGLELDAEAEEVEGDEELGLEGDVDVEAATGALEDLGAALGLELEVTEEGEGGVEEDLEVAEEDEDLDVDLEETYEVNETALRRELRRLRRSRRLREQDEAIDTYASPGAAEEVGDVIVDVDEDDLINVLADELGDAPTPDAGGTLSGDDGIPESRHRRGRRIAERHRQRRQTNRSSSSRTVRRAVRERAEYKHAAIKLKKQLVEMNLFNAKLLYANKLLQNKDLTVKHQRAIVEALDNAKTLREAKLLYKSLSGSLARRGRGGKTLSESVRRTLGSSSRSTRSAQPANSGVETDRWAVLAGINKS